MATSELALPVTQKITLEAGTPVILAGSDYGHMNIQIPTGTTVTVEVTCATAAEVLAGTDVNIWQNWPAGAAKAGPYMEALLGCVSALRFTSAAGGVVYVMRARV